MSTYTPDPQPWHADVPGSCSCEPAWKDRGMVDDRCYWHRLIDAAEELRADGWMVAKPKKAPL